MLAMKASAIGSIAAASASAGHAHLLHCPPLHGASGPQEKAFGQPIAWTTVPVREGYEDGSACHLFRPDSDRDKSK